MKSIIKVLIILILLIFVTIGIVLAITQPWKKSSSGPVPGPAPFSLQCLQNNKQDCMSDMGCHWMSPSGTDMSGVGKCLPGPAPGPAPGPTQSIMSIINDSVLNYWGKLYGDGNNVYIRINSNEHGKEAIWMTTNLNNIEWTLKSIPTTMTQLYTPGVGKYGWKYIKNYWNSGCTSDASIINGSTNRCLKTDISTYGIKDIQVNPIGPKINYNYNGNLKVTSNTDGVLTIPSNKSTLSADRDTTTFTFSV
jgi:hypothetical protein